MDKISDILDEVLDIDWCANADSLINAPASSTIDCSLKIQESGQSLIKDFIPLVKARRLVSKLTFLRWQYQSSLLTTKEKRVIRRDFERTFRKFKKHCALKGINYQYRLP